MKPRLDILTFHRIMPRGDAYFIPPMALEANIFKKLLERLSGEGRLIDIEEGVRQLKTGTLKDQKIAVSFDDGYHDNFALARDILLGIGVPATFFVPVGPVDEQRPYWWDHLYELFCRDEKGFLKWATANNHPLPLKQNLETLRQNNSSKDMGIRCRMLVQALNRFTQTDRTNFMDKLTNEFGPCRNSQLLMSWENINKLQQDGFSIGSHSISHIPLTDLDSHAALHEITHSARLLEERIGQRPKGFCYPRGAHTSDHARMVEQSGYEYAVTTGFGTNFFQPDVFTLKRRNISDYHGVRAHFPIAMHLLELKGWLDSLLNERRSG